MSDISEHDTKEERKDGNRVQCRINLLISGNTIRVDNLLERGRESVRLDMRRILGVRLHLTQRHERWKNLVQESCFLFLHPYFAHHYVVGLF